MSESIRTLFVANLPPTATNLELYLLFSTSQGYERSMIVRREGHHGQKLYGFVNYTTSQCAAKAISLYDDYRWDPEDSSTNGRIKVELSRRNTPDWFTTISGPVEPPQAKTLHVTGFPSTVTRDMIEEFVAKNFANECTGMHYTSAAQPYTFIGFLDHALARSAMERLNGFNWVHAGESSTISAHFANTEYNPPPSNIPVLPTGSHTSSRGRR